MQSRTDRPSHFCIVILAACGGGTPVVPDAGPSDGGSLAMPDSGSGPDDGGPAPDGGVGVDAAMCDPSIGLVAPIPECTAESPCVDLLPSYAMFGVDVIDTPSDEPTCATSERGIRVGRTVYDDGAARAWTDPRGVTRYHCEHRPPGTSALSPRPLVIWVPGSGGHAGSVYDTTSLRGKASSFDLSGDPDRPGFVLVSVQPRNLHWPTDDPQDGTKSDTFHRDLGPASTNPDVAFFDQIVDSLVAEGVVDASRVHVMGWSNGARFAAMIGIARHETPTAGGNRVAAVAIYSGGDPFANTEYGLVPSCELAIYPRSAIPLVLVSRSCDAVACDEATDWGIVPGNVAAPWVAALRGEIGADVVWQRIDYRGRLIDACASAPLCTLTVALLAHLHWPDGVEDRGGIDHEGEMLGFLRDHPLR